MISFKHSSAAVLAAVAALMAGCGGGADDSSTTAKAMSASGDTPTLSADQAAFEQFLFNGGSYLLHWNLQYSGVQGRNNYLYSDSTSMVASPLTAGPQTGAQGDPFNMTKTLIDVTPNQARILKDGVILVVPSKNLANRTEYVGNEIRVHALAADTTTVAYSAVRTQYETVNLSGPMSATPADFAHFHDAVFANPAVLDANAVYAPGSKYIKFVKTNLGDRYNAGDCLAATVTADVSPCRTGTTLIATMTSGQRSNSDGVTYYLADGSIRTVGGVPIWVANNPRPKSATMSYTEEYRIYFELNGNVYTGSLIKDGTVLGGSYYVSNPSAPTVAQRYTFLPYDIRLNKAAHDSLVAAMKI